MKVVQLLSQHQDTLIFPFTLIDSDPTSGTPIFSDILTLLLSRAPPYHRLSSDRWNTPPMLRLNMYHTLTYRFAIPKYSFLWTLHSHYHGCPLCSSTLPLCTLLIPAWLWVLGQWSKSYPVTSTQRSAPLLPRSGLLPLCSAGVCGSGVKCCGSHS